MTLRNSIREPIRYKYLRDFKSLRYDGFTPLDDKFERYIKTRILPLITFDGYKLKRKRFIALRIIASLWFAELRSSTISDDRNNSKNSLRIAVWDSLILAGLVKQYCIGSELSGYITRYRLSKRLRELLQGYDEDKPLLDYELKRNTERKIPTRHALVVIQTGKKDANTGKIRPANQQKKPLPFNNYPPSVIRNISSTEDKIEYFNKNQLRHIYKVTLNPCVKLIHSEQLGRYSMFHSWSGLSFQALSKKDRKYITIDGEQTKELDFSGYLLRQYYHFRGIEPTRQDIYQPDKILCCFEDLTKKQQKLMRDFIKKATIYCLNNKNYWKAFYTAKSEFLTPTKSELKRIADKNVQKIIKQKKLRRKILFQIEGINLHEVINRILSIHSAIRQDFFNPELYALTMSISAGVMLEILQTFSKKDKPVLPIHDSIIVKIEDAKFARKIMKRAYKRYHPKDENTGFKPVIK